MCGGRGTARSPAPRCSDVVSDSRLYECLVVWLLGDRAHITGGGMRSEIIWREQVGGVKLSPGLALPAPRSSPAVQACTDLRAEHLTLTLPNKVLVVLNSPEAAMPAKGKDILR